MGLESCASEGQKEIARGAVGMALATVASRVLGLLRDILIAGIFTPLQTDCYFMAFTIPSVLRRIFGEGATNPAIVPVYAEHRETETADATRRFLRSLWGASCLLLGAIAAIGVIASPLVVSLYAWGFRSDPAKFDLTVDLNRIMFPTVVFTGIMAISTGILNVHRRFFSPALSPAILNLAMIAGIAALPPLLAARGVDTVYALAAATLAGGLVQTVYQLALQKRTDTLVAPSLELGNPGLRRVGALMTPLVAGFGIYQVDVMLSRLFASFLPQGSVSYLYYGTRLIDFPQAVIFLALGTASLPLLSRLASRGALGEVKETFARTLSLTLFLSVPATAGVMLMAKAIVCVVFYRGNFTAEMFAPTWTALVCMAPGIAGTGAVRVITPVFYALKDTKTPVVVAGINLAVYLAACLALVFPFKHLGLAAALSIAPLAQLVMLLVALRRKLGGLGLRGIAADLGKIGLATAGMSLAVLLVDGLGRWELGGNSVRNVAVACGAALAGVAVYMALALLLGIPEARLLLTRRQRNK